MLSRSYSRRPRPARRWGCLCVACLLVATVVLGGCSSNKRGGWFKKRQTSSDYLKLALEAECPDERREGVIGLAGSDDAATEWATKVFDTIARTDTDMMVRCAAVRAMLPSANADRVPTLLKLLNSTRGGVEGVRPAPGPVRWEAAKLLLFIVDARAYDESQRRRIVQTLLDRLADDDDRNVKLTVIDTLAYFKERPIPTALIGAMEEGDYAVKHAAERALIALTGTRHYHDPVAWRTWLDATENPFENAGAIPPEELEVKEKRWWQRGL
ncbi:MAG: hypothetical protein JXQ75_18935 [Phycisphaerae bacterium]|nr:hypothetical protein [Phycisphaerae bacterium]